METTQITVKINFCIFLIVQLTQDSAIAYKTEQLNNESEDLKATLHSSTIAEYFEHCLIKTLSKKEKLFLITQMRK